MKLQDKTWVQLEKKTALVYVGDTRWYTHHSCVRHIQDNNQVLRKLKDKPIVKNIAGKSKIKREKFEQLLGNSTFWDSIKAIENVLRPTSKHVGSLCLSREIRVKSL